ncbi:MAG: hypothetical protein H6660_10600 [Ardenticatenaceae bacterium]|nr:hypothetical protein [Ardenticatenaceae bacterium]
MQEEQPLKPANILNIVAINQGKRPSTDTTPRATPLSPAEVKERSAAGHHIVDARSTADFSAGHIAGAVNVQLSSSEFEQRVGWMIPDNEPIILVTDSAANAQKAIFNMAFIGMDQFVSGYLEGGMDAWMEAGEAVRTVPQIDVHTLKHKLATNGLQVLDVRESDECDEGHIAGAHLMPYTHLVPQITFPAQIDKLALDKESSIAVTCATGKRSSTAISIMLKNGYKHLYNVTGGMEAWENAGFEMVDGAGNVCRVG